MISRVSLTVIALVAFSMPLLIWYRHTGDLSVYFSPSTPPGQWEYVLSKLFGLYAILLFSIQLIISLLGISPLTVKAPTKKYLSPLLSKITSRHHKWLGMSVLLFVLLHLACFFIAVTLRQESLAWGLLVLKFHDFYHTQLSFGLMSFLGLLLIAIAGILRHRYRNSWLHSLHKLYLPVAILVYTHALAIGTEFQTALGMAFYGVLASVIIFLLVIHAIYFASKENNKNNKKGYVS
ncbi:MAG: hypothetical protein ACI8VC_002462 [Candidatus Endobugula sp.]|jgi:hypothetical protein